MDEDDIKKSVNLDPESEALNAEDDAVPELIGGLTDGDGKGSGKKSKRLSFSTQVECCTYVIPQTEEVHAEDPPSTPDFEDLDLTGGSVPPYRETYVPSPTPSRTSQPPPSAHRDMRRSVSGRGSGSTSPTNKSPDWYEELSDDQIHMFKEVFELLDRDGGGSINTEELYAAMKDLDIDIKREEIEGVLAELDKDGNGEIDFDEFLYTMTMTDRVIDYMSGTSDDSPAAESYSRRQRLFFTAITKFALKNSLGDIERYYANKARQAPHVISFYTAGARLIGLNDRQLAQELRRLRKAAKNQDSPYAKLPFMTETRYCRSRKIKRKAKKSKPRAPPSEKPLTISKETRPARPASCSRRRPTTRSAQSTSPAGSSVGRVTPSKTPSLADPVTTPETLTSSEPNTSAEVVTSTVTSTDSTSVPPEIPRHFLTTMSLIDQPREVSQDTKVVRERRRSALLPESNEMTELMVKDCLKPLHSDEYYISLLQELAQSGSVVAKLPDVHLVPAIRTKLDTGNKEPLCSSLRKRRKESGSGGRAETQSGNKSAKPRGGGSSANEKPRGWTIPKMNRHHFEMPSIQMSKQQRNNLTIEDVPYIRRKVSDALSHFYGDLKKKHAKLAWDRWDTLHVDSVRSERLKENFRKVYCAYSPQREEDVFVIAPWIPGPRYTSATAGSKLRRPSDPAPVPTRPHSTSPTCGRSGRTKHKVVSRPVSVVMTTDRRR